MGRGRGPMVFGAIALGLAVAAGSLALWVGVQGERFERRVHGEARALLGGAPDGRRAAAEPGGVPAPVARYLEACGALRHAPLRGVRLVHGGSFSPAADARWFPIRGEQYLSADPPGFVWWGRLRLAPGLWIDARDRTVAGEGNMLVRAASVWTIADARGAELDRAALVRLLGELAWMPTVLADARYVRWAPVDARRARATLAVGGREVSATFVFGPDGMPERFEAERWRDLGDGRGALTPFVGTLADFREVDGLRLPHRLEAAWIVDGKPAPYARWAVERIDLDPDGPY